MNFSLPSAGSASPELVARVQQEWALAAGNHGVELSDFDPDATLPDRLTWARSRGLAIACILARASQKLCRNTTEQVSDCVAFAAANQMYVPPEFVSIDEEVIGQPSQRDGLSRSQVILQSTLVQVLLVRDVSRLFRSAWRSFQFIQVQLVEQGLRAISVSEGIDTRDERTWKVLMCLHSLLPQRTSRRPRTRNVPN